MPADSASTWSEDSHESSRTPSSPYPAASKALRPLALNCGAAAPAAAAHLAADVLLEQFERAQQYVASHKEDFAADRLETLQVERTPQQPTHGLKHPAIAALLSLPNNSEWTSCALVDMTAMCSPCRCGVRRRRALTAAQILHWQLLRCTSCS